MPYTERKRLSNLKPWFVTDCYSHSKDSSLVMIETADDDWGYNSHNCISKTRSTMHSKRLLEIQLLAIATCGNC